MKLKLIKEIKQLPVKRIISEGFLYYAFFLLIYLMITDKKLVPFFKEHWLLLIKILIPCLVVLPVMVFVNHYLPNKLYTYIAVKFVPKSASLFSDIQSALNTFMMIMLISFLIPYFSLYIITSTFNWQLTNQTKIYLLLTMGSAAFTFFGRILNAWLMKFPIFNSSLDQNIAHQIFQEDVLKTMFFGINMILIITTTILKYNHTESQHVSDNTITPFVQSFVTYIAMDRVVTTFRKAKENFSSPVKNI